MNLGQVEKIADAVLYEGYILYPYRPSAVKNRQRFNFGALYPEACPAAQTGAERWAMQTECLVEGDAGAALDVKARFLHLVSREVCLPIAECSDGELQASACDSDLRVVGSLEVGGRIYQTWQEAAERDVSLSDISLSELVARPRRKPFAFPSKREVEALRGQDGKVAGVVLRRRRALEGAVELSAERAGERLYKVTARVLNLTPWEDAAQVRHPPSDIRHRRGRDEALLHTLASTHAILGVRGGGRFVSLLDPPADFRAAVAACRNEGAWPVLVGEEGARDMMLASPIILYDYPRVAPESAGDLYDGTEIDEILTLRIMTLTDEEKREMRSVDERARLILERTETLPPEQLMKLHGAVRGLRPTKEGDG